MLVSKNAKICVTPNAKPKIYVTPNASQWNIGCVGSPGVGVHVGHVHFMLFVSNSPIPTLNSEDGSETYEGTELAEHINRYFAEIGAKLANDIITNNGINPSDGLYSGPLNMNSDNITNSAITIDELQAVLKHIDINKSSAITNIMTRVLVHAYKNQLQRIVKMYNGSLTLCTFPDKWKKAIVVPLPKVNNPKTISELRPISLLPFPGKLMEIIISQRLKRFLNINDVL